MKLYSISGKGKPLEIRLSKKETEQIVLKKYKKVNTHPRKEKRK